MARTFLKIAYIVEFGDFVISISKESAAAIWLSYECKAIAVSSYGKTSAELSYR